jgi:hypothetical protein
MARERRSREYDEWMKKLHDAAKISINEAELEKIQVDSAAPPQGALPPGMTLGHPVTPPPASAKVSGN